MPTAVITGAAGGIGRSICEVFMNAGYTVIGVDLQESAGPPCEIIKFDISMIGKRDDLCGDFFNKVERLAGGMLDALVNNAAVQIVKPFKDIDPRDWEITLNTNLLAPFWLTQRFYPLLKEAKGSVVNISSIHASLTKREFTLYSTSKGALVSLTRALALDLAPDVRVNAVLPAATDTPMLRNGFKDNIGGLQSLASYHPVGRIARTEEIAQAVLFLAGSGSSFMTGTAISVDGGIGGCLHDPIVAG